VRRSTEHFQTGNGMDLDAATDGSSRPSSLRPPCSGEYLRVLPILARLRGNIGPISTEARPTSSPSQPVPGRLFWSVTLQISL
jgi:hypothetical protein